MKNKNNTRLNFVDIFSGAGGLSCGMEMSGMKCLLGVDSNKHAINTFQLNHKDANTFCGDIKELTKSKLLELTGNEKINAVVGGPPCQGFSTAGLGNPDDERNELFLEFIRIVKVLKPDYVIVENVTGLLAKKNEKTLTSILSQFKKLGFNMNVRVMSAQEYGVAEKRKRTIFIGSKINQEIKFPKPTHDTIIGNSKISAVTVGDVLSKLESENGDIFNHDIESAEIKSKIDKRRIKRIPEGKGIRYEKDENDFFTPSLKLGINWNEIREKRLRQTKYQRLDRKTPGPTIMTHRHTYYHPTEHRFLTQREAARIQSFPNDFIFSGPLSAQWRQIGNAVPPLLGKNLGFAIQEMYKTAQRKSPSKSKEKVSLKKIKDIRKKAFTYVD